MRKLSLLLIILFVSVLTTIAQKRGISYQAVAIDENGKEIPGYDIEGNALPNAEINVRFGIYNESGDLEYQETHETLTDHYGLFNLVIGYGNSTTSGIFSVFDDVVWSMSKKFLRVEIDINGGSNYKSMSYQELLSVPFAKFAETSLNPGPMGISIDSAHITSNGDLILILSDSTEIYVGSVLGPQGPPGQDGMTLLGTTIDLNGVNLDNNGEFQYVFADDGIEVFEDDAVLVYHSTDFIENPDGDINIWKLMPQTIYYDPNGMGQVVYNFDHTFNDVLIFLQSNFDLNELSIEEYNSLTKDQYFDLLNLKYF